MIVRLGPRAPVRDVLNDDKGFQRERPDLNETLLKEAPTSLALAGGSKYESFQRESEADATKEKD